MAQPKKKSMLALALNWTICENTTLLTLKMSSANSGAQRRSAQERGSAPPLLLFVLFKVGRGSALNIGPRLPANRWRVAAN